jgi:amino acid permease
MTSKYQATFTLLNIILGSGPLIIPQPFYQAGFILSTAWYFTIGFISFLCAEYIVETLARTNAIKRTNNLLLNKQSLMT